MTLGGRTKRGLKQEPNRMMLTNLREVLWIKKYHDTGMKTTKRPRDAVTNIAEQMCVTSSELKQTFSSLGCPHFCRVPF